MKSDKQINQHIDISQAQNLLSDLKYRAGKINYKNTLPRLPKNPTESTMMGFYKRLHNWQNVLEHLEIERAQANKTVQQDSQLVEKYLNRV